MKEPHLIPYYLSKMLVDEAMIKAISSGIAFLIGFLFPGTAAVSSGLVMLLVILDTGTGMRGARVRGEAITSAKLGRVLTKLFGYFASVVTVSIGFRAVPGLSEVMQPAVSSVIGLVAVTEIISIFENLRKMGINLPDWILRLLTDKERQIESQGASDVSSSPKV